ncbi:unnamed protein product [Paramecium pentaurelia]|uniref:Cyclic nucleotide-binding domain-containing protein n=1 Tax=Paramecium pentaurelia TaxID=43138 RepID=A0A8S1UIZ8_9CILI|nr:unnamed protein product [Paramecium pentaurelia]
MFLIKYTETLDHDIDDIDTVISLYQTHERLITENLIKIVLPSFKKIDFFEKHRPQEISLEDFIRKAIPYFRYEEYSFGEILYNIGDEKQKLFIILEGSAMEFIPIKKEHLIVQQCSTPVNQKSKRAARQIEIWELVMRMQYHNPLYWKGGQVQFQQNETYKVGQHFGDLSNDENAKETVIASSQLLCISMKKSDYKLLFGRELAQTRKNLDFFKNLFHNVSENKLLQFINFTKQTSYEPKQQLWQKGDEPKYMIFVIDGLVETYHYENINIGKSLIRRQKISIRTQSTGCLVGAEEIIQKVSNREYCCQCISKTEAFLIRKEQLAIFTQKFYDIFRQMNLILSKNIQLTTERKKEIYKNNPSRDCRRLSLQNTPDQQISTENYFTENYFCTPRKQTQDKIRSSIKGALNLKEIVKENQQMSKSQSNFANTIYPIENQEHYEIMLRFISNAPSNQNTQIQNSGQFQHCLDKIKKKVYSKKFNSQKKFILSPQIQVSKINCQDVNSQPVSPMPLDNAILRKKLQSRCFENNSNNKSTTTQIFSARQSQIDFETHQIEDTKSCAQFQNFFQITKPLFFVKSRDDRLLSQQTDRK